MGLRLTWHDVVHMYECYSLANLGYYLKSRSSIVRLVSCLPKSYKGMKDDYLITSGEWHDGLIAQLERESQVVYPRVRSLNTGFSSFSFMILPLVFHFPLMMGFIGLIVICSSVVFVDKRHVAPHLSSVNIADLNRVLRFEVFVSEDRQLSAVHLILDFKPILDIFQEMGHAIRAGDLRLCRIDVSVPRFLA